MKASSDGKVTMTFREYDLYEESAENCGYMVGDWYPNMETARKMVASFADNVLFMIWLLNSTPNRQMTADEAKVRSFLSSTLNHRLVLED